jgi:hypothetical protein
MKKVRMRGRGGVRSDSISGGDGPLGDAEELKGVQVVRGEETLSLSSELKDVTKGMLG